MKPSWDDAPEWAQWLAMDAYGEWYWYEEKPEDGDTVWIWRKGFMEMAARSKGWVETLEPRP